jgi:hypothetical protein
MQCTNLEKPFFCGFLSPLLFIAVLPFYLQTFPLYLTMSFFHRLLLLCNRRGMKEVKQVSLPDTPPNHPYETCDIEWQRAWLEHVYLDPIPDCDQFPL